LKCVERAECAAARVRRIFDQTYRQHSKIFGAEMFRRLPLDQQAAVVRARAEAWSAQRRERSEAFETMLRTDILSAPRFDQAQYTTAAISPFKF
jgi:hypothetical protein